MHQSKEPSSWPTSQPSSSSYHQARCFFGGWDTVGIFGKIKCVFFSFLGNLVLTIDICAEYIFFKAFLSIYLFLSFVDRKAIGVYSTEGRHF